MLGLWLAAALAAAPPGQHAPVLLSPSDLDPALVLPPPPAAGSAQATAEFAELHAAEAARTPTEEADARLDGDTKNATIFAVVLGPRFDLDKLPATARLMALVRASEKAIVDTGKDEFRRPRPYAVEPGLKSCKRNEDPLSSYPSGHTSMAFSMGETLARLVPAQAPALLARAARYGQSRIVCGQHFRSDVSAGHLLGGLIVERLMTKAAFQAAFAEARSELIAAGIAQP
ncbi:phosphatase PAP2 family protein [Sphingomonas sp. AR_OL41]|uniref:phosphatase PAP2 family protein n=1 Tax=Sphingomonas sp. AR_OL41 TaxID=3042729 RepID=UPI00248019FA|nr:phosphatase PAP2 family protein [Sphingomonas sp. AR_OL41]MDH7973630.1 phosphatase PAP2 family protein [Sphingomonas sp. AR_OL41]